MSLSKPHTEPAGNRWIVVQKGSNSKINFQNLTNLKNQNVDISTFANLENWKFMNDDIFEIWDYKEISIDTFDSK